MEFYGVSGINWNQNWLQNVIKNEKRLAIKKDFWYNGVEMMLKGANTREEKNRQPFVGCGYFCEFHHGRRGYRIRRGSEAENK